MSSLSSTADIVYKIWNSVPGKVLLLLLVGSYVGVESFLSRNDLDIFLSASRDLFAGENIYRQTYFDGYHYYYSTLFATLIYPLTVLPVWLSKMVWLILNVALVSRCLIICSGFFRPAWLTKSLRVMLVLLLTVGCLRFIRGNLHLGQVTALILWLSLEGLTLILNGRRLAGSMLLALAINIKLMPLVFVPYLIYRRAFHAAFYVAILCLLMLFLPAIWLGWDQQWWLLSEYGVLIDPRQAKHILDVEEASFHSLTTLLSTLFVANANEHNGLLIKRNIAELTLEQLQVLILLVRIFFVAGTLWFLRTKPFVVFRDPRHTFLEISYLMLVMPLIFPHQQHYAFLFAMPAMSFVLLDIFNPEGPRSKRRAMVAIVVLVFLLFNLSLWLGIWNAYYNHFKILTYGALLLVWALFISVNKSDEVHPATG